MESIKGTRLILRSVVLISNVFISLLSNAQLCTGSFGDPVVNITFGNGNSSGQAYAAPGYIYTSSACPNDGYYTITTSAAGCFNNTWHTLNSDHTGNGAFMLVNANYQPADFFLTTVQGLCPNTTYQFSAWIMNVLISPTGIKPNITFSIETPAGTVLNTFNTGDIFVSPQPEWKEYGFYFTTTVSITDVVLRITNNAPGGIGNDLALDDILFRPCGPVINSVIQGNNNNVDVCINDQLNYDFNATVSSGNNTPAYQWQLSVDSGTSWKDITGATTLIYQRLPTPVGKYWYRLSVAENGNMGIANCRTASNILVINVHAKPVVNAGPDKFIIKGEKTTLEGNVTGENVNYSWSPPDFLSSTLIVNPDLSPDQDILYTLSGTSQYGCTNTDYVFVKVVAGIFIPSAFTPNNDGKNDTWRIPYLDPLKVASIQIYNRYGQIVYKVTGSPVNWDGNFKGIPLPGGVFVYIIRFKNGAKDLKGTLTLIR